MRECLCGHAYTPVCVRVSECVNTCVRMYTHVCVGERECVRVCVHTCV